MVRTILGVVHEAMREHAEARLLLLRPGTREHDLVAGWLRDGGLDASPATSAPPARAGLVLDPADKQTLLLDGPLPGADLLPLGDVWPSQVAALASALPSPAGPSDITSEPGPLECALRAAFDRGEGLSALRRHLSEAEASTMRRRILQTAPLLRPPTVPKLTAWTIGIDPGP